MNTQLVSTSPATDETKDGDRIDSLEDIEKNCWELWKMLDGLAGSLYLVEKTLGAKLPNKDNFDSDSAIVSSVHHCQKTADNLRDFVELKIQKPLQTGQWEVLDAGKWRKENRTSDTKECRYVRNWLI